MEPEQASSGNDNGASGYAHPLYAQSLAEFGTPRHLVRADGWILERPVPDSTYVDAMGCYPLFCCRDWRQLPRDVSALGRSVVALSLVADPFAERDDLERTFERVAAFKRHYLVDLSHGLSGVTKHHLDRARRALARMRVELVARPLDHIDAWTEIYAALAKHHGITGMRAFSRQSFATQLTVPGVAMFRAAVDGETLGFHMWYCQGLVAYSHLTATTVRGRQLRASFALYYAGLEWLSSRVGWADLGGSPGAIDTADDSGLAQFKRGWASTTRIAYFCSQICDADAYRSLAQETQRSESRYFPAYRAGELL